MLKVWDERLPTGSRARRVAPRRLIRMAGQVSRTARARMRCELTDISATGCRLTSAEPMRAGDQLTVEVLSLSPVQARVAWSNGDTAGLEFGNRIDAATLSRILSEYASEPPRDDRHGSRSAMKAAPAHPQNRDRLGACSAGEVAYLREQEQRCRRLAKSIQPDRAAQALLSLADEYGARANSMT